MKKSRDQPLIYILLICLAWLSACNQNEGTANNSIVPATPLSPTTEPIGLPTDIQFVLEETYTPGEIAAIKIQNVGAVPYYFEAGSGPCNLSFFDIADQQLWHHQHAACDTLHLAEIKPGESGNIFNWDLTSCDQSDCLVSRPLIPGTYKLVGRFIPSSEFGSEGSQTIAEATVEVVSSTRELSQPPIENSLTINTDDFQPLSANFSPMISVAQTLFFSANYYEPNGLISDAQVFALDSQSGEPKWVFHSAAEVNGLASDQSTLFMSSADRLYALHHHNGEVKWVFDNSCCFSSGLAVANDLVYAAHSDGIYAVASQTGQWQFRIEYLRGSIAVGYDLIYVGASDGLYALESQTGQQQWRLVISDSLGYPEGIGTVFPLFSDESIYFWGANGRFYAIDSQTGDVRWEKTILDRAAAYPGPASQLIKPLVFPPSAVSKEMVYLANGSTLLALNNHTGEPIWQFQPGDSMLSAPVMADGYLFVTSGGKLQALDSQTGQVVWQTGPVGKRLSEPVVGPSQVFMASSDGVVRALNSQIGEEEWRFQIPCIIAEQICASHP